MAAIVVPGERLTGVNSQGETPTAKSLIEGSRIAQLPVKKRATISGQGNRKPGVDSQGMTPTATSLIDGSLKAPLPKSGGQ